MVMSNEICICEKGIRLIGLGNTLVSLWTGMWLDGGVVGALKLYSMQIVLCSVNCASNVMEGFFSN